MSTITKIDRIRRCKGINGLYRTSSYSRSATRVKISCILENAKQKERKKKKARDLLKRRISRRGRGYVRYYLKRLASRLGRNERNSDSRSDGGMSGRTNGSQSILEAWLENRAGKVHERDPCESAFRRNHPNVAASSYRFCLRC